MGTGVLWSAPPPAALWLVAAPHPGHPPRFARSQSGVTAAALHNLSPRARVRQCGTSVVATEGQTQGGLLHRGRLQLTSPRAKIEPNTIGRL